MFFFSFVFLEKGSGMIKEFRGEVGIIYVLRSWET